MQAQVLEADVVGAIDSKTQRESLALRLIDLLGWPESRISLNERNLAADVLTPLLRTSDRSLRMRCAKAVARLRQSPGHLLRYLACDEIDIARPILLEATSLRDLDAMAVAQQATPAHWRLLAQRKDLSAAVCESLVLSGDPETIHVLLENSDATFACSTMEVLVRVVGEEQNLVTLLLERPELRPAQGLTLFWRCNASGRLRALQRFAADRAVLVSELGELFSRAKRERWRDPGALNALGFIERRQRRRVAADESTLEQLIAGMALRPPVDEEGFARLAVSCGLTPLTVERVLTDPGGEPFAVLAKSVGLRWAYCEELWRALGLSIADRDDRRTAFGRMAFVYDTLPTAKAQSVLRYWNWALMADAIARRGL